MKLVSQKAGAFHAQTNSLLKCSFIINCHPFPSNSRPTSFFKQLVSNKSQAVKTGQ